MDLYILNREFETVGLVDAYTSLIWTERYKEMDDFEMEILLSDFLKTGIRPDYFVYQRNSRNLMVVEKFELKKEDDEPPKIKITGHGLESILDWRMVKESVDIDNASPDEVLQWLLNDNFTKAKGKRQISMVKFVDSEDEDIKKLKYSASFNFATVLDVVLDICESLDLGLRAWYDENAFKICYQFYKGVDRSWSQDNLKWIVYSPKFNNLLSTTFKYDNTTYRNSIVVFGEEASQTTNPTSGDTLTWDQITIDITRDENASGLYLKEGILDCTDVSRWQGDYLLSSGDFSPRPAEDVTHGWKKLPAPLYRDLLWLRAQERMDKNDVTMVYEAEADEHMQWKLGEHLYLGDIVQVVSEFTLESRCRVSSVIFSHDINGIRYYPTFEAVDNNITQEGGTVVW